MATRTPAPRPDDAPEPQDHKTPAEGKANPTLVTVELDGREVVADFAAFTNVRLMRKVRRDDFDAILDLFELAFPDLDAIEEAFGLTDIADYLEFIQRVQAEVPNSQS